MYMGGGVGRREGGCSFGRLVGSQVLRPGKHLSMYSHTAVALAATASSCMPAEQNDMAPNQNLIYRQSYDNDVL